MRLLRMMRTLAAMPPSRRGQWFTLMRARLVTATLYALRLQCLGKRSIVQQPLFWTPEFIEIGSDVLIWPDCRIEGINEHRSQAYSPKIVIGDHVSLQQCCHIVAAAELKIGRNVTISSGVFISDSDHAYEAVDVNVLEQPLLVRMIDIGSSCFIGTGARILAGTRLGDHCIVGANAVVRGTFPSYCVIVGIPAKIVKRFNPESGQWLKTDEKGGFI